MQISNKIGLPIGREVDVIYLTFLLKYKRQYTKPFWSKRKVPGTISTCDTNFFSMKLSL